MADLGGLARAVRSLHDPPLFRVRIRDGGVTVVEGRVPAPLLRAMEDVARNGRVDSGSVTGRRRSDGSVRLEFGGRLDETVMQRFRNVAGMHL